MKKWINYIFAAFLLLLSLPSLPASAATDASGKLEVNGNDIAVSLHLPEGETEEITSLQLKLSIALNNGTMEEPSFQFDNSIESTVKDAAFIEKENGGYTADIILSGKKDQDIFKGSKDADIGILSLKPNKEKDFSAVVSILGEETEGNNTIEPIVTYVDSSGYEAQMIPLYNTEPVTVSVTVDKPSPEEPSTPTKPTDPVKPTESTEPDKTTESTKPTSSTSSEQPTKPATPVKPAEIKDFTVQYKNTSQVTLSWKKATGADGYQIFRSKKANGTYTFIKAIKKGSSSSCNLKQKNNTLYYYKIRAYKNIGTKRGYGPYTNGTPSRVKAPKVIATAKNRSKYITLKWNKLSRTDGYRIYQYNPKTKKYHHIKTISRSKTSYSVPLKRGTSYYFVVRGYETWKNKRRTLGNLSSAVKVKTAPSRVSGLSVKASKAARMKVSWKKVKGADGYCIYRSNSRKGKWTRIAVLPKNSSIQYVDTKVRRKKTYYYKVRAYAKEPDGKCIYGNYSKILSGKVR